MGATHSKLNELSTEDISGFVTNLGDKYKTYGEAIASNAVDGDLLMEMEDTEDFKAILQCLEITNFLHQKKLMTEWKKAKAALVSVEKGTTATPPANLNRSETDTSACDASTITMDTSLSASGRTSTVSSSHEYCRPIVNNDNIVEEEKVEEAPPVLSISLDQKQVLEPLELPKSLAPDDPVLEPYFELAVKAGRDLNANLAMVNVLDVDMEPGEVGRGYNNLSSITKADADTPLRLHFDEGEADEYEGVCRKFILGSDQDFHIEDIPKDIAAVFGWTEATKYYGHVVKIGDLRIGSICIVVEETPGNETSLKQKQDILKVMADLVKGQLEKRAALMQRKRNLKEDLRQIKASGVDPVLAAPVGPLQAVTASQVAQRQSIFPYPNEPGQHPNGCPTAAQFTRRSATLPAFHNQATEEERAHLPDSYYDDPAFEGSHETPLDLTPVAKNDMERVALLQSLHLIDMEPGCREAEAIQSLVDLAGALLNADWIFVALLTHEHAYCYFSSFPNGPWPQIDIPIVRKDPYTGKAFQQQLNRATTICNYALATPNNQCFVAHDTSKDQSLAFHKQTYDIGFYSGAPLVVQGLKVGSLCVCNRDPNSGFGRVQELQQEQLAELIAQEYETWALGREVQQLETRKNLFLQPANLPGPVHPPEDYVSLVFTEVQGRASLLGQNPEAASEALELHNRILRSKMAECRGYEVTAEESSFEVAFSDESNAVEFCLKTQEALHRAVWGDDLLVLSQAKDVGAFRGLRVKMSIHCGDVESSTDPVSKQVSYGGETFHIAQNLRSMGHGGQILITSDVWNAVGSLKPSRLGSPQVVDLGSHVVPSCSKRMQDGIATKSILQLMPSSLAHDYLQSRRLHQKSSSAILSGRTFPRIKTRKSLSASFNDAPFDGNNVSLLYIDTSAVERMGADSHLVLAALSKRISSLLNEQQPDGYQCQDFMLAFDDTASAVRFGLRVQDHLAQRHVLDLHLKGVVRIGVHEAAFETMSPNAITGRAEYFGSVADSVVMVAKAAAPGSVIMGKKAEEMDEFNMQPTDGFLFDIAGKKSCQVADDTFFLYTCQPCRSWYDRMIDQRNS